MARKHEGVYADSTEDRSFACVLQVIGQRPKDRPYLAIREPGMPPRNVFATITNANALRGLSNAIRRALGDE